jgi:hypothetical protein
MAMIAQLDYPTTGRLAVAEGHGFF